MSKPMYKYKKSQLRATFNNHFNVIKFDSAYNTRQIKPGNMNCQKHVSSQVRKC